MKKNGFTLVELIATIALLGFILAMVFASSTTIIKKNRKNAFKIATEELVDAVDLAITADNLSVETLNSMSVSSVFESLGIDKSNADNYKSVKFSCVVMSGTTCIDYTIYVVGKGKYEGFISFGHNNNLSADQLTTEIGITMNYVDSLENYMNSSSLSDGTYDVMSLSVVSRDSEITGGTVVISNNRVINYSINFGDEKVIYDQEKRLPVIE